MVNSQAKVVGSSMYNYGAVCDVPYCKNLTKQYKDLFLLVLVVFFPFMNGQNQNPWNCFNWKSFVPPWSSIPKSKAGVGNVKSGISKEWRLNVKDKQQGV